MASLLTVQTSRLLRPLGKSVRWLPRGTTYLILIPVVFSTTARKPAFRLNSFSGVPESVIQASFTTKSRKFLRLLRFLGATALVIRAIAAGVSGRGSPDVASAAPLTAICKPDVCGHSSNPLSPSYYGPLCALWKKKPSTKVHWRTVAGQASVAPQDGFEGWRGQPLFSSPCPFPHRHNGCSCLVRLVQSQSEMSNARTCSAERPRNFTTAGWGNYGHFGSDATQI